MIAKRSPGPPMTLGNMRRLGVRGLIQQRAFGSGFDMQGK
jgi:hypothetical protein